jgi:hypothetical protein
MINNVRNTVMFFLNKDNNGYLTPDEFNAFARQAQLEVFEDMFYQYNKWLVKRNTGVSYSGSSDIAKLLSESIDKFSTSAALTYSAGIYNLPTDLYSVTNVLYSFKDVERIEKNKLPYFLFSNHTAPTTYYPAYSQAGTTITVYPSTIQANVSIVYNRYPLDPKWTYYTDPATQAPLFDQAAPDYRDFEVPDIFQNDLIIKILKFAGVTIRENEIVAIATAEEQNNQQQQ